MCRNIKTLFNFEPPATELEIRDASLQFVRKISGYTVPSKANEAAFEQAVEEVAASARRLIASLVTPAAPRSREQAAALALARSAQRFGPSRLWSCAISAPGTRARHLLQNPSLALGHRRPVAAGGAGQSESGTPRCR